jgi:DNA polymerase III alpha subunit (gram-positive type)
MRDLIFLDTETTGLDPAIHEVWEIAFAINDSGVFSDFVPHSLATADPVALEINNYWIRGTERVVNPRFEFALRECVANATIVGANPAFDAAFLRARWGVARWHHRLIDVESMALIVLDYERPKGLFDLAVDLRERGYDIPAPSHTATGDVLTTRAVYHALREEGNRT